MTTKKYISELITEKEIETWQQDNNIFIYSAPDTGKTTFITTRLEQYARKNNKKILLLEPRTVLKEQQKEDVKQSLSENIDVCSYQYLDCDNCRINLNDYQYIVPDECHFLFSDSGFNNVTNDLYEKLINTKCIKIWISGTPFNILNYFDREGVTYKLYPKEHIEVHPVGKIYSFASDEELESIIELEIELGRKALVVINNTSKLLKLYRKYESNATLLLGTGSDARKRSKKINEIVCNETEYIAKNKTFSNKILFATSAIDCGTSIKDFNFSEILTDSIYDMNQLRQIVSRKRQSFTNDTVTLFVRDLNNWKLNGYRKALRDQLKPVHYLLNNGIENYFTWCKKNSTQYPDSRHIIYQEIENGQEVTKINDIKLYYVENMIDSITNMIGLGKSGFKKTLQKTFGVEVEAWTNDAKATVETILELYCNKGMIWWTKQETQKLANELGFKDRKARVIKSAGAINGILENEYHSKYRIITKRKKKSINGTIKRFDNVWMIQRIE